MEFGIKLPPDDVESGVDIVSQIGSHALLKQNGFRLKLIIDDFGKFYTNLIHFIDLHRDNQLLCAGLVEDLLGYKEYRLDEVLKLVYMNELDGVLYKSYFGNVFSNHCSANIFIRPIKDLEDKCTWTFPQFVRNCLLAVVSEQRQNRVCYRKQVL